MMGLEREAKEKVFRMTFSFLVSFELQPPNKKRVEGTKG